MRKSILLVALFSFTVSIFSQKKDKVLLTINSEKIKVSEFKRVYEKNLDVIDNDESKNVENNLELFINYKLKVKEAYDLELDTLKSYVREINTYRDQLSAPYLTDKKFTDKLVEDAYFRTKIEIKVKHILVKTKQKDTPKDTLIAYNKVLDARNKIISGVSFEDVAKEVSEDPSAKTNGGNLGYFSAFRMVYPFENAAYNTKIGEISMPFKTRFGYHIVKVDGTRTSRGEVEVAHILVADTTQVGKTKIDEAYGKLQKNEKFEALTKQYSDDTGSKNKGGKLGKFGGGRMVKPFENAAFSLTKIDSYSKPIKTRFGWHIIKLLNKFPVKTFEEMKEELTDRVKKSGGAKLSKESVLKKLKNKYTIVENESAKEIFKRKDIRTIPKNSLQETLFSIENKNIKQEEFVSYIKNKNQPIPVLFEKFKEYEIVKFYKINLVNTEPDYAYTLKEYEDGLLLFELMQQKIWNKSAKDTLGLQNYFTKNFNTYKTKELKNVKGRVMNDYQTFLEEEWIADLRKRNTIIVNKKQLKRLIKLYK